MKSNYPYAYIRPVCACVFSLSIVCEIQAQERNDSNKLLPPVVVTAARIVQPQTDALLHTTILVLKILRIILELICQAYLLVKRDCKLRSLGD